MRVSLSTAALLAALTFAGAAPAASPGSAEATIRALDEAQRVMAEAGDAAGLDRLAHPNLRLHAATINEVLTREQFFERLRRGAFAKERYERIADSVTVSGGLAVVMGRETFTPLPTSDLTRVYGTRQLSRRFTNVYVLEDGRWRWLVRHANFVEALSAPQP